MQNNMDSYSKLADHYNKLIDCDYDKWSQFLIMHGCKGRGVDLACGTGNVTFRLAEAGCTVVGFDVSSEMLSVAESQKKKIANPTFRRQSMTEFCAEKGQDFVTCVCDGVNYVGAKGAKETFRRVFDCLKDGGVFIFDISSEYKLKHVLGNGFFYEDGDELTYLWTNSLKKDRVVMELAFFVKEGDVYRRFDERHVQFIHTAEQLQTALKEVGFEKISLFDGYREARPKANSQRIVFCAQKQRREHGTDI